MAKYDDRSAIPPELRKQLLITQGAMYRSGILVSKEKVAAGLRADSLTRSAIKQIGLAVFSAWRNRSGLAAAGIPALLPVAIAGIAKLWRQPTRSLVRGTLIAGALASVFTLLITFKKKSAPIR